MAYSNRDDPEKMVITLKVHKWHARNACFSLLTSFLFHSKPGYHHNSWSYVDVQGLIHQQFLSSAMVQHCGLTLSRESTHTDHLNVELPPNVPDVHSHPSLVGYHNQQSLLLFPLQWGDQTETGDETEVTLRCLRERNVRKVICSRACVGEPLYLIYWEETTVLDHGRGQELLVKVALHIPMRPSKEHFKWDGGLKVLELLNHCEEARREELSSPTFDLQWCAFSAMHGYTV